MEVEITDVQIDVIAGIAYSQVFTARSCRPLRMTVMIPRTGVPKPAVVYFPGGGFVTCDYEKFVQMRLALAKAGFVVAAAEYRTVPDKYPAPVIDGKAAVRFLRAHASLLEIDPARIGVLGDSSGGYLAQMIAVTGGDPGLEKGENLGFSSEVQAAATLYGISDLRSIGEGYPDEIQKVHASPAVTEALMLHGPAFGSFPGAGILSDPAKALEASPLGHIRENLPPFLIMHGIADTLVSPKQSSRLYEALSEKGNDVSYVTVEGAGHGDLFWYQPQLIETVTGWFRTIMFR